jgi:hypothetical protein
MIKRDPVPIELFGRDHWSTLCYLETRAVDYKGVIGNRHMRCDLSHHPTYEHECSSLSDISPTRLKGCLSDSDEILALKNHDDWDCVDDFIAAGLVFLKHISICRASITLSAVGWTIAGSLRKHRAEGSSFSNFIIPDSNAKDITHV